MHAICMPLATESTIPKPKNYQQIQNAVLQSTVTSPNKMSNVFVKPQQAALMSRNTPILLPSIFSLLPKPTLCFYCHILMMQRSITLKIQRVR